MELVQVAVPVPVPMEWEDPIHYSYRVRLVLVPVLWLVVHSRMYLMQLQFAVRSIDYLVCPRSWEQVLLREVLVLRELQHSNCHLYLEQAMVQGVFQVRPKQQRQFRQVVLERAVPTLQ